MAWTVFLSLRSQLNYELLLSWIVNKNGAYTKPKFLSIDLVTWSFTNYLVVFVHKYYNFWSFATYTLSRSRIFIWYLVWLLGFLGTSLLLALCKKFTPLNLLILITLFLYSTFLHRLLCILFLDLLFLNLRHFRVILNSCHRLFCPHFFRMGFLYFISSLYFNAIVIKWFTKLNW